MRLLLAAVAALVLLLPAPAGGHGEAEWIGRAGYRNAAGELCCGELDCARVDGVKHVTLPAPGYRLPSGEFVPETETLPSPDGAYWRCEWGGTRKCFFAPPESY
jgi:hypothetical protein